MHHALEIEEILVDIFNYCCPTSLSSWQRKKSTPDLAALARTCRAFKEPALDVLWSVLVLDLSPLARCLPDASCRIRSSTTYSFDRPPTLTEWYTLQNYTRRIRYIRDFNYGLDRKAVVILSDPPPTVTLFPNLRELQCTYSKKTKGLLSHPLPSLVSLDIQFASLRLFRNSLDSLPKFSPNISTLFLSMHRMVPATQHWQVEPSYMSRWQNLRSVICPEFTFDADALVCLSRMPSLTQLNFTPSAVVQTFRSPLLFPNLRQLILRSYRLDPVSQLLSRLQLSITTLTVFINSCPSKHTLSSFINSILASGASRTLQTVSLSQSPAFPDIPVRPRQEALLLDFEDLQPCMACTHLRSLCLDIEWDVGLTDDTILALTSAWPALYNLQLNPKWGWNVQSGLTPTAFVALLTTCRALRSIDLALDLRDFTEWLPLSLAVLKGIERTSLGLAVYLDVLDTAIERESVQTVTDFFWDIADACPDFTFTSWNGPYMVRYPGSTEYYIQRWNEVYNGVWPVSKTYSDYECGVTSADPCTHACERCTFNTQ